MTLELVGLDETLRLVAWIAAAAYVVGKLIEALGKRGAGSGERGTNDQ